MAPNFRFWHETDLSAVLNNVWCWG